MSFEIKEIEIAPAKEYEKWDHDINTSEKIISLRNYKGVENNAIVYGKYEKFGTIYNTKILIGERMFSYYTNLDNIKTVTFNYGINTTDLTDINGMFSGCTSLTNVDFENFNTGNVIDMHEMFNNCKSLVTLNLSNLNTKNVKNMKMMFYNCSNLMSLNLRNFDTRNVTNMEKLFFGCRSLISLDLTNFDTRNVTNMSQMFADSPELKTIYVSRGKWIMSQADTTNMFSGCGTTEVTYVD